MGLNAIFELYFGTGFGVVLNLLVRVVIAIALFFIGRVLIKNLLKLVKRGMLKHGTDPSLSSFVLNVINAALLVGLVVVILTLVGYDASSLAALVASAGVAFGLAVQGSLSNFAGGVLLLVFKPFSLGDYIKDAAGNEGTVRDLGIVYTTLLTVDGRLVTIPNGALGNGSITNYTKEGRRCVCVRCGISYGADLPKAKQVFEELLSAAPARIQTEKPVVIVAELAESSVVLEGKVWTEPADYWTTLWSLQEQVKMAFDENKVEIPFPQLTVHFPEGNGTRV